MDELTKYGLGFVLGLGVGMVACFATEEHRGWHEQLGKEQAIQQAYQHGLTDCRELTWGGVKPKEAHHD